MKAYERLLKYVKIYTTSDEESKTVPSTSRQFDLAKILVKEMKNIGIEDVKVDDKCYVYGYIKATKGYENKPSIGLIAHMDTAPSACGENVNPNIIENYNGEDVILKEGTVLSVEKFPHLKKLKGRTLITTDGNTLLGADDKAGIAEILTACEHIINENIPHGKICIAFTPDEEIGRGAENFNVKEFGADFAYTIDGGEEGEISYENFNAASAKVNYEGFYYLEQMEGNTDKVSMSYILRDHDSLKFQNKKDIMIKASKIINEKYGENTIVVHIKDQYKNMLWKN